MRTVTKPLTSSQLGNYPHTAENSSRKTTNTNSHYIRDPNGVVRKSVVTALDSQRRTIGQPTYTATKPVKTTSVVPIIPASTFHKAKRSYVEKLSGTNYIKPYSKNTIRNTGEARQQASSTVLSSNQGSSKETKIKKNDSASLSQR